MRKLLLLFSCSCFFIFGCCNKHVDKSQAVANSNPIIKDTAFAIDTTKTKGQVSTSGIVGKDQGIQKDTTNKTTNTTAIIHTSPDQAKIDSIKNAKQKLKDNPK